VDKPSFEVNLCPRHSTKVEQTIDEHVFNCFMFPLMGFQTLTSMKTILTQSMEDYVATILIGDSMRPATCDIRHLSF
jgi:hypothetical protein